MAIQQTLLRSYGAKEYKWYGSRATFGGGWHQENGIQYVTVASLGNASSFGNIGPSPAWKRYNIQQGGPCAGEGRGMFLGGQYSHSPYAFLQDVNYITIATTGNGSSFGNLSAATARGAAGSNGELCLTVGGYVSPSPGPYSNIIEYFTIATTGNSTDYGDLNVGADAMGGFCNAERGIFAGGTGNDGEGGCSGPYTEQIQAFAMPGTANASDIGNLIQARGYMGCVSDKTRGVWCGGYSPCNTHGGYDKVLMDYVTIATAGNAIDFGDLDDKTQSGNCCGSEVRGILGGGSQSQPAPNQAIQYFTIQTAGNASDFGDLATATNGAVGNAGD